MFPRPSRLVRLIIFLSLVVFLTVSMYVMNLDAGTRRNHIDEVPKSKVSNLQDLQHSAGSQVVSNIFHEQRDTSDHLQGKMSLQAQAEDVHFDEYVLQRLKENRKLSFRNDDALVVKTNAPSDIINPHNFKYIHNPSTLCQRNDISFLVYIHSSPGNIKKRQAVRQTWGHPKLLRLYNATVVFVLGRVLDQTVQKFIDMESEQYGDILQEDFIDSYRNLTYKGVAGLKWASAFCKVADFMLKTDDDILLDIVTIMENLYTKVLPERKSSTKLILCNLWTRMKVIRDTKSKWYISKAEFAEEYFPPYCSGSAFLLSADMAPAMYETSLRTQFFWVDDYYITGMLVNKLEVKHTRFNPVYLLNYNVAEEKLKNDSKELLVFHVKKLSLFLKLWPILMQRHRGLEKYLQSFSLPVQNFSGPKREDITNANQNTAGRYESVGFDNAVYRDSKAAVHRLERQNTRKSG